MSEPTPIERKRAAEANARVCRQEAEKLRDQSTRIEGARVATYRKDYGYRDLEKLQMVRSAPLRAFLIQHLEAEALRYEREANRLRFEVIKWAEEQREEMQAEIAAFNAERLA